MIFGLIPTVYAQCAPGRGDINLGDCLKLSDSSRVSEVYGTPAVFANLLVSNIFVVAGIIILFTIVLAGFKFITGGQKGAEDAKNIVQTALIGFVLMFSAYWIMQIITLFTGISVPGVTI